MSPSTTIVVLSYNRLSLLRENLLQLRSLTVPAEEIIVVDNASSDGSAEMVRREFPEVRVIVNESNLGVARGRNCGFRAGQGDYIIYLDDDSLASPDICEKTVAAFERFSKAGCLGYQILQDGRTWYECPDGTRVGNYYGGGHAFRKTALEAIGYLDESMWFGGEEIDSSLRLYRAGYEVVAVPSIRVTHRNQPATRESENRRSADWFANFFAFYARFFPLQEAALYISRMTASYAGLCLRRKTVTPLAGGLRRALSQLPNTVKRRDVVSPSLARFYADPRLVPTHYNKSILSKALERFMPS